MTLHRILKTAILSTSIGFVTGLFGQRVCLIEDPAHPYFGSIEVMDAALDIVQVHPAQLWSGRSDDRPGMLGKHLKTDTSLIFTPRFPFIQGRTYVVRLKEKEVYEVDIPVFVQPEPTRVQALFPSTSILPANQLKLYIHFSNAMAKNHVYQYLKLLDENGDVVAAPFLELTPPLWDKDGRRLTVWFDPGRIKRHLGPNQKFGPPLSSGQKYKIVISKSWKDTYGQPLQGNFSKEFLVAEADRYKPDPDEWTIQEPPPGTAQAIIITFPEPMDRGLLDSSIGVFNQHGEEVVGSTSILDFEKKWSFIPESVNNTVGWSRRRGRGACL